MMSTTFVAVFFVLGCVAFLLATVNWKAPINLVALGLLLWLFVYAWNAVAAT